MAFARRILIVDDDTEVRQTLVDLLCFEGFSVDAVGDGQDALAWLRAHPATPWLILLDLMMPVMSGPAFLDVRRTDPHLSQIPVIVLTAGGDVRQVHPSHNVARCLTKTIPPCELVDAIVAAG
jgi:CheY-like chemotaxis protein